MTLKYPIGDVPSTSNGAHQSWKRVDGECRVCGKRTWCQVSSDGAIAMCRRDETGAFKSDTDSAGVRYHLHWLIPPPDDPVKPVVVERPDGDSIGLADVDTRHQVYGAMLAELALSARHLDALVKRGLSTEEVALRQYRTFAPKRQVKLAAALYDRFGKETLLSVPGFFVNPKSQLSTSLVPGLLVPVRDVEHRIIALKIRPDERLDDGTKYLWVSSRSHGGPGPGAQPHVPLGINVPLKTWRLTEGELKADVATVLSGVPTLSAPGATVWRPCVPILKALGCRAVRLAFDADARENREVGRALAECYRTLKAEGFAVAIERWDPAAGKGIDDVLVAGGEVEIVDGEGAAALIAGYAGAVPPVLPGPDPVHPGKPATNGAEAPTATDLGLLSDDDLGIVRMESVRARPVSWLWKYRLERGGLALLAGDAGIGKSQVLLATAATVSVGGDWADGSGKATAGNVVIVSAEDRPDRTIKPRLTAMGADMGRIVIVKAKYVVRREGKEPLIQFASFQDHAYWKEVFRRVGDVQLFIADPIPSYLGRGVNDSRNREIREVLEPFLSEVIEPLNICMWGNTHLNKAVDAKTPLHRITGSIAYGALPRNVHFVVRDPDDPGRRYFKQAKANDAPDDLPAVAFRVERRDISNEDGESIETAIPIFEADTVAIDLGEMVNGKGGKRGPEPKKTTAAAEWIFDHLADRPGATPLAAVFEAAGLAGLAGKKKPDGRWSGIGTLYDAMRLVPTLGPPRDGKCVEELVAPIRAGGRGVKHWYLCGANSDF